MGNEKRISITNVKKNGELSLGFKGIDGKLIDFSFGTTIDDTMVDKEILENSMKNGKLSAYIKKGWAIKGKINVNNMIIGSPEPFNKIEAEEVIKSMEPTIELSDRKDLIVNEVGVSIEEPKINEVKAEEVAPEKKVGRGRPKKDINVEGAIEINKTIITQPNEIKTEILNEKLDNNTTIVSEQDKSNDTAKDDEENFL